MAGRRGWTNRVSSGSRRGAETYLAELSTALREGTYRPQPIRRVEIPKGDGRTRPLGIPAVKDRIVQTAVMFALEPIFEAMFCSTSYGFRPGRGCRDALREVDGLIAEGHTFVVDADLASYFDTIPNERLMAGWRSASAMAASSLWCAAFSTRTSWRSCSDGHRPRARRKVR
jgi:retron-type reverse transcriptase